MNQDWGISSGNREKWMDWKIGPTGLDDWRRIKDASRFLSWARVIMIMVLIPIVDLLPFTSTFVFYFLLYEKECGPFKYLNTSPWPVAGEREGFYLLVSVCLPGGLWQPTPTLGSFVAGCPRWDTSLQNSILCPSRGLNSSKSREQISRSSIRCEPSSAGSGSQS